MTNYNKRLDELMPCDCKFLKGFAWRKGDPCEGCINGRLKQAITSLTKELVTKTKPEKKSTEDYGSWEEGHRNAGWNNCLEQFEQNLLKVLGYEDEK